MTRFQLVFRHPDGDQTELRDNNGDGLPHIGGKLIVDGDTYVIRGAEWLVEEQGHEDGLTRFVCTLVVAPNDSSATA